MRRIFFLLACCCSLVALSQQQKIGSLEVTMLGRYDQHADYATRFGNRSYTNHTRLEGVSYGLGMGYTRYLSRYLYARAGFGLYQLRVGKIWQMTPWGWTVPSRATVYQAPDLTKPLYSTRHYYYLAHSLSVGVGAVIPFSERTLLTVGGEALYYHAFFQRYQLNFKNTVYKSYRFQRLGMGVNADVGLQQQMGKFYIHPKLVVPIYQVLMGDEFLGEERHEQLSKQFRGGGVAINVGKYF